MDRNIGKNIRRRKYSQEIIDHAKQSAKDALKSALKRVIPRTAEATGDLTGNTFDDGIPKVSKISP